MISDNEYVLINSLTDNIVKDYSNICFHRSKFTDNVRVEIELLDNGDDVDMFEETLGFVLSDLDKCLPSGFVFSHMLLYPDKLFREVSCSIVITRCC